MTAIAPAVQAPAVVGRRAVAAGIVAGVLLLASYIGIITLSQGAPHALEQFRADAPFVLAVMLGFGTQMALFVELRRTAARHRRGTAMTAASTGTSVAAMLACCAHHVADLLPLLGVSAAAVFLDTYKAPLLVLGVAMNAVGVAVLWRELRRARRACEVADRISPAA
ncbi:MAG: hypothetical protein ACYDAN_09055 [Candidatus Limnocylindrales bacterium]